MTLVIGYYKKDLKKIMFYCSETMWATDFQSAMKYETRKLAKEGLHKIGIANPEKRKLLEIYNITVKAI